MLPNLGEDVWKTKISFFSATYYVYICVYNFQFVEEPHF